MLGTLLVESELDLTAFPCLPSGPAGTVLRTGTRFFCLLTLSSWKNFCKSLLLLHFEEARGTTATSASQEGFSKEKECGTRKNPQHFQQKISAGSQKIEGAVF